MPRSVAGQRQIVRDFGTCLLFNGTTAKVSTSLWTANVSGVAMSIWFKSNNYKISNQVIISNGEGTVGHRGFALVLSGNGTTDGSMYILNHLVAWISLGFKVRDNNWHHIILSIDSSNNTYVYLDGVQKFSGGSQSLATPTTASYIGTDGGTQFFSGKLDDARFYTSYVSPTDAANLFYGLEPTNTPTNWYKLDEGSGATANDSGSSPKNGSIANATYSTDVFMKPRTASGTRTLVDTRSFMT